MPAAEFALASSRLLQDPEFSRSLALNIFDGPSDMLGNFLLFWHQEGFNSILHYNPFEACVPRSARCRHLSGITRMVVLAPLPLLSCMVVFSNECAAAHHALYGFASLSVLGSWGLLWYLLFRDTKEGTEFEPPDNLQHRHCFLCKRQRTLRDHHCGILGICVHQGNRKQYALFLALSSVISAIVYRSSCARDSISTASVYILSIFLLVLAPLLLLQQCAFALFISAAAEYQNYREIDRSWRSSGARMALYTRGHLTGIISELNHLQTESLLGSPGYEEMSQCKSEVTANMHDHIHQTI